jgi:3-dehydroquinate dehydratase type I
MPPRSFLQTKKSLLATRPLVVGVLTGTAPLTSQIKKARSLPVDVIEVRLDSFSFLYGDLANARGRSIELLKKIRLAAQIPILLTIRSHAERGPRIPARPWRLTDAIRLALFRDLLPFCRMVDVELRHPALAAEVTRLARRQKIDVVHSHHNFQGVTSLADLKKAAAHSRRLSADVLKVAVTPETSAQCEKFLWGGMALPGRNKVLIAMGPQGVMSRFIGFSFGSILAYGYLGTKTASGQVSAREMTRAVRRLYAPLKKGT